MRLRWPVWGRRTARRSRVALAVRAACVAQAAPVRAEHTERWAAWLWGDEVSAQRRLALDAKRVQAWRAIDATLADLLAS